MTFALVILVAIALAGLTYLWLERVGTKAWPAIACRAVAWAALGVLLVNLTCALPASSLKPMVLFDGSLSMGGAGGRWREALDTAKTLGDVRWFGDEAGAPDTMPSAGRSLLGPALVAAAASGRPIIVVSDGELEDVSDVPPELLSRVGIRTFPRQPANDVALTRVSGPALATVGDTVTVGVEIQVFGTAPRDSLTLELRTGRQVLLRRRIGAATGGVIGALIGAGIPEYRAKVYETGLLGGGILLGVEAKNDEEIDKIEELLEALGGQHVRTE